MASKQYEAFYNYILKKTKFNCSSIQEFRIQSEQFMSKYPLPSEIRKEPFSIGNLKACWFLAPEASRKKMILFFHGGGYVAGSVKATENLIGRLSLESNAGVLAISYRLAPENPYPAALEDALAAYRWMLHQPYPRRRIAIVGVSAGAGLALSLLLKLKLHKIAMPAGVVCISPWVDLSRAQTNPLSNDIISEQELLAAAKAYMGEEKANNPFISPLYGEFKQFPPVFIQTGTRDLIHVQALQLAEKMKKDQVNTTLDIWPDMIHNWPLFSPEFPEANEAIQRAGKFLERAYEGFN